jgi:hypothetical protein
VLESSRTNRAGKGDGEQLGMATRRARATCRRASLGCGMCLVSPVQPAKGELLGSSRLNRQQPAVKCEEQRPTLIGGRE